MSKYKCPRCEDRELWGHSPATAQRGCGLCQGKRIPSNKEINEYIFNKHKYAEHQWGDLACIIREKYGK